MSSNLFVQYRNLFIEAYNDDAIIHKPTIISLIDSNDKFWKDYEKRNNDEYLNAKSSPILGLLPKEQFMNKNNLHDEENLKLVQKLISLDISANVNLDEYISDALDKSSLNKAIKFLKNHLQEAIQSKFPMIKYITSNHYSPEDIWEFIKYKFFNIIFHDLKAKW